MFNLPDGDEKGKTKNPIFCMEKVSNQLNMHQSFKYQLYLCLVLFIYIYLFAVYTPPPHFACESLLTDKMDSIVS